VFPATIIKTYAKNMNDIIFILIFLLIIFLPIVLIARWRYKKKVKKETETRSKLTPEERKREDKKWLDDVGNTLTVIVPTVTLMAVSKDFGWTVAILVSVAVFIIGRLLFGIIKKHN
jgi:hypothetical protein